MQGCRWGELIDLYTGGWFICNVASDFIHTLKSLMAVK